jgi:RNA polymerase sigma factor (TIGR02999 family)
VRKKGRAFTDWHIECAIEQLTLEERRSAHAVHDAAGGAARESGESILPFWAASNERRAFRVRDTPLTDLIGRAQAGDTGAEAEVVAAVYPELRRLARRYLSSERRAHTLQTTELIHEAWLRLFGTSAVSVQNRNHLIALMATQMRRALVDYARHRNAAKGPGASIRVALTDSDVGSTRPDEDVLAIDEALTDLEAVDARVSKVVELRFFGGLREDEAADALGVSVSTLKRDWAFARAWLYNRLTEGQPGGDIESKS